MNYDDKAEVFFFAFRKKDCTRLTHANQITVREMTKNIQIYFSDKNLYTSYECVILLYLVFNKNVQYQNEKYPSICNFSGMSD